MKFKNSLTDAFSLIRPSHGGKEIHDAPHIRRRWEETDVLAYNFENHPMWGAPHLGERSVDFLHLGDWFRIISLPTDRLAAHCYWTLLDSNTTNDPWLNSIQNIINSSGQYFVWNEQKSLATQDASTFSTHAAYISQTIQDVWFQNSVEKMENESKLTLLKNCKSQNKPSNYLKLIANRKQRSLLSKLRLGTLDLEIEKSRKHNIPRAERHCKLCNTGEVENEIHFILNCPALSHSRESYIKTLSSDHSFMRRSPESKVKYLYFNENLPDKQLILAADMLSCLKDRRYPGKRKLIPPPSHAVNSMCKTTDWLNIIIMLYSIYHVCTI